MPQNLRIPKEIKEQLWKLYYSAYCKGKEENIHPVSIFLAKESIDAVLQHDNYPMAVDLANHAEDKSDVWHEYNWCLQEEYWRHISNVYTANPLECST